MNIVPPSSARPEMTDGGQVFIPDFFSHYFCMDLTSKLLCANLFARVVQLLPHPLT